MAQESLAKSVSNSNLNSRRHLMLYQKVLYTGAQMASILRRYDQHYGLPKATTDLVCNWDELMKQLAEVLL